jgi:YbbR domain-containing protein
MRQLFTQNLGWKLASLLLAVGLWLAVAREPEVATSLSVPVEFKNMRDDLDISGNLPDRISLELRGPSGRLTRDNLSTIAAVLDLADAQAGDRTYNIRGRNLNLPSGVVFYRSVPSQLTLHFEQLSVKNEPVQPVFVNKPASYRIASQEFKSKRTQWI